MSVALQQFGDRLDQLLRSLADIDAVDQLAALELDGVLSEDAASLLGPYLTTLRAGALDRRVYSYASCTVLLYGLFEQYVEALLVEYVEEMGRVVPAFSQLAKSIVGNHSDLSAKLMLNVGLDKYKDRTTAQEVARRVASCVDGAAYELNALAYIDHSSNLRIGTLNQLFAQVGVGGLSRRVMGTVAFKGYVEQNFPGGGVHNLPDDVVFAELANLVDRRNTIGHGWPDDMLAPEYMREMIEFIRSLGQSLFEVLRASALPALLIHRGLELPAPIAVYDKSIVCVELLDGEIAIGSTVIVRRTDGSLTEARVLQLEVEHTPVERVSAPPALKVGARLDVTAKATYRYYLVRD